MKNVEILFHFHTSSLGYKSLFSGVAAVDGVRKYFSIVCSGDRLNIAVCKSSLDVELKGLSKIECEWRDIEDIVLAELKKYFESEDYMKYESEQNKKQEIKKAMSAQLKLAESEQVVALVRTVTEAPNGLVQLWEARIEVQWAAGVPVEIGGEYRVVMADATWSSTRTARSRRSRGG